MTKVSVIVPVYNSELYLEKTLESLINQTLKDIEIICINDGSTDGSDKILEQYADRITVINQENSGQGAARNTGIEAAKGEFIAFMDADDWAESDFYEKLYNASACADIVCGNTVYYENNKYVKNNFISKNTFKTKGILRNDGFDTYALISSGVVWNKIYRRETVKDLRFPTDTKFEDTYYNFAAVLSADKIARVKNAVIYYNIHPGSDMTGLDPNRLYDYFKLFGYFWEFARAHNKGIQMLEQFEVNVLYSRMKEMHGDFKRDYAAAAKEAIRDFNPKHFDWKTRARYNRIVRKMV
ncbi:MAG: glycosyltransferase [Heliobacteriaceae bacterium]|jgi:glycosyltransferase involved in cell wall biosynthesis|nr:glycosyltransferase [Heliobacteriaceae bacterium]